jgi:stearoyl-CoA desaturase (Delta-9 desaturase)
MSVDLISAPPSLQPSRATTEALPGVGARAVTALIVGMPLLALILVLVRVWGTGVPTRDLVMAFGFYFFTGHGVTVGFHRLLTHRSFVAVRPLKLALVAFGSMAFEGGPIGWVAAHRRHHAFADTEEDPHSPRSDAGGVTGQLKGLWHAHWAWLFTARLTSTRRYASDLLADRDMIVLNALFPLWCVVSLALPFGLGWILGGTLSAAFSAFLWAGLVRVALVHHATWSINSVCHTFGRRPFATKDRSSNVGLLAVVSMGESWHNNHHAFPRSARHGLLPGQWDSSAVLIRAFQRLRWVRDVHRPSAELVRSRQETQ